MIDIDFQPLPQQRAFLESTARYKRARGGIGSGKSMVGAIELLNQPKGSRGVVMAPTYPQLIDSTLYDFKKNFGELILTHRESPTIETKLVDGKEIMWWSGDKPQGKRGPNVAWAWMDESDYTKREAFLMLVGRLRLGRRNIWMTSSPTGVKSWVAKLFKENEKNPNYAQFTLKTKDNFHNSAGYYEDLTTLYTKEYARQELEGEDIDIAGVMVKPDHIRYEYLPDNCPMVLGVDPAISQSELADYTTFVVTGKAPNGNLFTRYAERGHLTFYETINAIVRIANDWQVTKVCVEAVAYQSAIVQELRRTTSLHIEAVTPRGKDKVSRFQVIAGKLEHGYLLFDARMKDKQVCTEHPDQTSWLIDEILEFPESEHDDGCDALMYSVQGHDSGTQVYDI